MIATEPGDDGRTARILVSDTGRGLPAEDRDRLFLPYVSTKKEGGGLGLAIVSDIVAGARRDGARRGQPARTAPFSSWSSRCTGRPPSWSEIMEERHAG